MRRSLLFLCAFLGIVLILGFVLTRFWPVPRYQGRTVVAWISEALYATNQQPVDQATAAVRAAGTNYLDFWFKLLAETNEPPLADFWNSTIGRSGRFHRETLDEKW